jgi:predicted amidohydrolase
VSHRSLRVACLQLAADDHLSKDERLCRVAGLIEGVEDVDLLVLPELWAAGYFDFDGYEVHAEELEGPTLTMLAAQARHREAWLHGGSLIERDPSGALYNTSVLLDPAGQLVHIYRKSHLFGNGSREAELLQPGRHAGVASTEMGPVAMTTCYDLRFPELYRSLAADQGADVVLVASAWPAARLDHWEILTRARAVENQTFLVACNSAGIDHGTELAGNSIIVDPWGRVLARAGDGEEVLRCTLDLGLVAEVREDFPVLRDRWMKERVDALI